MGSTSRARETSSGFGTLVARIPDAVGPFLQVSPAQSTKCSGVGSSLVDEGTYPAVVVSKLDSALAPMCIWTEKVPPFSPLSCHESFDVPAPGSGANSNVDPITGATYTIDLHTALTVAVQQPCACSGSCDASPASSNPQALAPEPAPSPGRQPLWSRPTPALRPAAADLTASGRLISNLDFRDLSEYLKVGPVGWFLGSAPKVSYDKQGNAILTVSVKVPIKKVSINGLFKAKFSVGVEFTWKTSHTLGNTYPAGAKLLQSFSLEASQKGYGVKKPVASCPPPKGFAQYAQKFQQAVSDFEDYVNANVPALERALFDFAATGQTALFQAWASKLDEFGAWIRGER